MEMFRNKDDGKIYIAFKENEDEDEDKDEKQKDAKDEGFLNSNIIYDNYYNFAHFCQNISKNSIKYISFLFSFYLF